MLLAKELPSGRIARKHKEDKVFSIYGPDGVTLSCVLAYEDIASLANVIAFDEIDELADKCDTCEHTGTPVNTHCLNCGQFVIDPDCKHPNTNSDGNYCYDCGADL